MTAPDAARSPRELGARKLGGYRVLRSLARDERAEVVLGHRSVPASSDESVDVVVQTVALKVSPSSDAGWQAALREVSALERARGEHVVDLLDLDADDECIRLIFERLPGGDLTELLRVRSHFDAGEAVTLLAPIALTLLRLHAAGVAHGNLSTRSVLFRDDGSPTLIGFSGAELFEPDAPEVVLEQIEAVRHDRAAARDLATTVLGRAAGSRGRAARELLDDVASCDEESILLVLASRLFDVAAAVPLRFAPDESEVNPEVPGLRAIPAGEGLGTYNEPAAESVVGTPSRVAVTLGRVVPEALLQRLLDGVERSQAASVVREAVRRWRSWTPGRRRIVVAVGAAALTVAVVTAVVPAGVSATRAAGTTTETWPSGAPSGSPSAFAESDQAVRDPAVTGDDPVAASRALLSARDRCLGSLSLRCLDQVDDADSGALKDDQAAIRVAQQGGELPDPLEGGADEGSPVLVQRLGESALVRLGAAPSGASLLLVKSGGGWRIRDVIAAVDSTG